ncbi:MAG: AAA family ATPase [Patescibacteria group bacterium]
MLDFKKLFQSFRFSTSTKSKVEASNNDDSTKVLVDNDFITIQDDGDEFKIIVKEKERDLDEFEHVRVFFQPDPEQSGLIFFDSFTQQLESNSNSNIRRDNFSELDKGVDILHSEASAKLLFKALAKERVDTWDGFDGVEFESSIFLKGIYPKEYLQQVYNFVEGMENFKSEFHISFLEVEKISRKEILQFRDFFTEGKHQSVLEATKINQAEVLTALQVEKKSSSGDSEEEDLAFSIDLSTPAFTGYLGYDGLVASSRSMVNRFFNNAKLAKYSGKAPKDKLRMLLYGPPGTGKTQYMIELYKYAVQLQKSKEGSKGNFKLFKLAKTDFGSAYHNESEKNLQEYLDKIEEYLDENPENFALFFIDEVDEIAAQRVEARGACDKSDNSVITILLKCLSDKKKLRRTILVCATNFYDQLDAAFKRPGRFDQTFHMGYLKCEKSIEAIFNANFISNEIQLNLTSKQVIATIQIFAKIMSQTGTTTPAEIASIVSQIKSRLDHKVEEMEEDLLTILESIELDKGLDEARAFYITFVHEQLKPEDLIASFYATYPKLAQESKKQSDLGETEQNDFETNESDEPGYFLNPLGDSENPIFELECNQSMVEKLVLGSEYVQSKKVDSSLLSALDL